jgi:hypothetical protein
VSLNRYEQTLYDYVKSHPDERQYWQDKVRALLVESGDPSRGISRLDAELWRYFQERSAVSAAFGVAERGAPSGRISMKNLAELLVRLWTEPRTVKPAPPGADAGP